MSAVSDGPAVQHNSRARRVSIDAKVLMTAFIKNCRVASIRPQPTTPPLSPDTPPQGARSRRETCPAPRPWLAGGRDFSLVQERRLFSSAARAPASPQPPPANDLRSQEHEGLRKCVTVGNRKPGASRGPQRRALFFQFGRARSPPFNTGLHLYPIHG